MLVFLVRHPAPDIEPGRCYGRLDLALSPQGEADLPRLESALPRLPVWTSPARRCRRLADRLPLPPTIDPRLQELDFGDWEGLPWDDIPRAALDAWAAAPDSFAAPGGEPVAELRARISSFYRDLLARAEDGIVVSHGGPLKLLTALLLDQQPGLLAPAPPIASITRIDTQTKHVSTAQSATTAAAPSTSPVNPPI